MGIWNAATGNIQIKITSADITGILKLLAEKNIILYDINFQTALTACVSIRKSDYKNVEMLLMKRGAQCAISSKTGLFGVFSQLKRRYIMVIGVIALLVLTIYIPSRIFFIQVQGNRKISSQYITERAVANGITFGCDRWNIRSAQLKNRMLEDIPELDWVGITTAGCVATIEVKEKDVPNMETEKNFCSIVSAVDGVVESVTVTKGKAICVPGQAVRSGQLLISGYVDQGLLIRLTGAEGEVFAKTLRKVEAVSPTTFTSRGEICETETSFALQFGKKVINFSKHSSISPMSCVKIYSRKYVTLPGGFILPIALIREDTVYYETYDAALEESEFTWLESASVHYLEEQMLAGKIIEHTYHHEINEELCTFTGTYICTEQIGKYKFEESPVNYGENS